VARSFAAARSTIVTRSQAWIRPAQQRLPEQVTRRCTSGQILELRILLAIDSPDTPFEAIV